MLIANVPTDIAIIHFIDKYHEVEHLTSFPDVNAKNPFIHEGLAEEKNGNFSILWDVKSCSSFIEKLVGG